MHKSDQKPVQLLNSLIGINNNRLQGYNFAAEKTEVLVLRELFSRLIESSETCRQALVVEVYKLGGVPETNTLPFLEFYSAWVRLKSALNRRDHAGILNACLNKETAVLKYYGKVAAFQESLTTQHCNLFGCQLEVLITDHKKVSNLCNVLSKAA